jgi:predicted nucleic acid-binding protein
MILIDTNVLVALVDERDGLRPRAREDLGRLAGEEFGVTELVLGEACYLLPMGNARQKLWEWMGLFDVTVVGVPSTNDWEKVFAWMGQYSEHRPDLADAVVVTLSGTGGDVRVWTYDREFRTVWRLADGSAVPMAVG